MFFREKEEEIIEPDKNLKPKINEPLKKNISPTNIVNDDQLKNDEEIPEIEDLSSKFKFLKRKSQKMKSNKVYFLFFYYKVS